MTEQSPKDSSEPQDMNDAALGDFPDDPDTMVPRDAGDDADATEDGHSGGARGSEAGLGRHEPEEDVKEEDVENQ